MTVWLADIVSEGWERIGRTSPEERIIEIANRDEIDHARQAARRAWADARGGLWPQRDVKLEPDVPRPRLQMPAAEYAPDIASFGLIFVSARARYAMAIPPRDVQYLPIEMIDGSDLAYQQDYKWLSYLPCRPVMDLERSQFEWEEPLEGSLSSRKRIGRVTQFILCNDLDEATGLFWCAEMPYLLMADEITAWRLDRAGCTGIRFQDPERAFPFTLDKRTFRRRSF